MSERFWVIQPLVRPPVVRRLTAELGDAYKTPTMPQCKHVSHHSFIWSRSCNRSYKHGEGGYTFLVATTVLYCRHTAQNYVMRLSSTYSVQIVILIAFILLRILQLLSHRFSVRLLWNASWAAKVEFFFLQILCILQWLPNK